MVKDCHLIVNMSNKNENYFCIDYDPRELLKLDIMVHILMYWHIFGVFLKSWKSKEKLFYDERIAVW